jgi:hypothetical protein
MPGDGDAAASAGNEVAELAAFADLVNNAAGTSDGGAPAGCNLHVAAAALLPRLLAVLPVQPPPQLLADVLQLEAGVRGERVMPTVCSLGGTINCSSCWSPADGVPAYNLQLGPAVTNLERPLGL